METTTIEKGRGLGTKLKKKNKKKERDGQSKRYLHSVHPTDVEIGL